MRDIILLVFIIENPDALDSRLLLELKDKARLKVQIASHIEKAVQLRIKIEKDMERPPPKNLIKLKRP